MHDDMMCCVLYGLGIYFVFGYVYCGLGLDVCIHMITGWSPIMYYLMYVRMLMCLECFCIILL